MSLRLLCLIFIIWLFHKPVYAEIQFQDPLLVADSDTLTLTDEELVFNTSIEVKDNSTLRIVNSSIYFEYNENLSRNERFTVSDFGRLELVNTVVEGNHSIYITVHDEAEVYLNGSTIINSWWCSPAHGFHYYNGLSLYNSSKTLIENSEIGDLHCNENATATIHNSTVYENYLPGGSYRAKNSTVSVIYIKYENQNMSLQDLQCGFIDYFDMNKLVKSFNIILENVNFTRGFYIQFFNCSVSLSNVDLNVASFNNCSELVVEDSSLHGLYMYARAKDGLFSTIINCNISYLGADFNNREIKISDSFINSAQLGPNNLDLNAQRCIFDELLIGDFSSDVIVVNITDSTIKKFCLSIGSEKNAVYDLHNVNIDEEFNLERSTGEPESRMIIRGDIDFGENITGPTTTNGYNLIKREYALKLLRSGKPLEGVLVELVKGNQTLDLGESDETGEVLFNITYASIFQIVRPYIPGEPSVIQVDNFTDSVTLMTRFRDQEHETQLDFFTDTPLFVEFQFNPLGYVIAASVVVAFLVAWLLLRSRSID